MKAKKNKTVYIGLTAGTIHHGHIKLIEVARSYGDIIIGLITDNAIAEYKRIPLLSFEQRKKILINFKGVKKVVIQKQWDYSQNIKKLKPNYMIHGDDWKKGHMSLIRKKSINALKSYGGKLIELPYTKGISSAALIDHQNSITITPDIRRATLRKLIEAKNISRFLEAHNPISALIGENTYVQKNGKRIGFDGFWSSSLTDSTMMGKPDNESVDISQRIQGVNQIFDVTTKPLIFDGDTGGKIEHFEMKIKSAERLGISAIIIEDKTGLKKNSLFKNTKDQTQEDKKKFAEKISIGKKAQSSKEFMIIARIESFILGKGLKDAIDRAHAYVKAGADGIMIHSKSKDPKEIFQFSKLFRKSYKNIPLISVPSSYNHVKEKELQKNGFNVVIYANHMLRAAYPAMRNVALDILNNSRSKEADKKLLGIKEILNLIPGAN
jgi:phosphoenolpyruvate phosphomutase / 2-hydroxyethylphosphonate cytidylyltransferase